VESAFSALGCSAACIVASAITREERNAGLYVAASKIGEGKWGNPAGTRLSLSAEHGQNPDEALRVKKNHLRAIVRAASPGS